MIDIKLIGAIFKGALTFVPGFTGILDKKKKRSKHGCSNAMFCYILWFKTLSFLKKNNLPIQFKIVAEIGSGGSLGIAFCALLSGSREYCALEIENNFDVEENLALFDEILLLFRSDHKILELDEFDRINIKTEGYSYYSEIINNQETNINLSPQRIQKIRANIAAQNGSYISIYNDWQKKTASIDKADFVFSRAVLEHVNSPVSINKSVSQLIGKNGIVMHDIEFHSHDITKDWYSHNDINGTIWNLIKGKRRYYLNRFTFDDHVKFLNRNMFNILDSCIVKKYTNNGILQIYGAAILAQKI